jgi:hypothetical protein
VFSCIAQLQSVVGENKKRTNHENNDLSAEVGMSESISNQKFLECLSNMYSRLQDGMDRKLLKEIFNKK